MCLVAINILLRWLWSPARFSAGP